MSEHLKKGLPSLILAAAMILPGAKHVLASDGQDPNVAPDFTTTLNLGDNPPDTTGKKDLPFRNVVPNLASDSTKETGTSPETPIRRSFPDTITQRLNGGFTKQDMFVVSNEDGWEHLTNDLNNGNGLQDKPQIDFSKEFVVAAFKGFGFTQREGIAITGVEDFGDHYVVNVLLFEPEFDNVNHKYEKNPSSAYHLIKIPEKYDSNKSVEFKVTVDTNFYDLKEVRAVGYDTSGHKAYGPKYVERNPLPEDDKNAVPFIRLASGDNSEIDYAGKTFVSDQKSLEYIWKKLGRTDEVPKLDFENNTILFVTRGSDEVGGKTLVKRVYEDDENVNVIIEFQLPRPGDNPQNRGSFELIELKNIPTKKPRLTGKDSEFKSVDISMYEITAPYAPTVTAK